MVIVSRGASETRLWSIWTVDVSDHADHASGEELNGEVDGLVLEGFRVRKLQVGGELPELGDESIGLDEQLELLTDGFFLQGFIGLLLVFLLVEVFESELGGLFHLLHHSVANVEARNENHKQADKQADQRQDEANAKLFDVLAKAHRHHRLLFGEEILIVGHGSEPPGLRQAGDRRKRRTGEETRAATASPEAGALVGGTARRPRGDGQACGSVPIKNQLITFRRTVSRGPSSNGDQGDFPKTLTSAQNFARTLQLDQQRVTGRPRLNPSSRP